MTAMDTETISETVLNEMFEEAVECFWTDSDGGQCPAEATRLIYFNCDTGHVITQTSCLRHDKAVRELFATVAYNAAIAALTGGPYFAYTCADDGGLISYDHSEAL